MENYDLKFIRKSLPDSGLKLLEEKTGLSRHTIFRFFKGDKVKPLTATKILDASLESIAAAAEKSKQRLKFFNRLKEDTQTTLNI